MFLTVWHLKLPENVVPSQFGLLFDGSCDQINRVQELDELKMPPGNRLERLKDNRKNQYSIHVNQQYGICFTWEEGHAYEVEITDYH